MKAQVSIEFSWRDDKGNPPRESDIDDLQASGVRQSSHAISKGLTCGVLKDSIYRDGKVVDYEGEWEMTPIWRLVSRVA